MTAELPNITLFYERAGAGAPLILLHGNGEDHTIFERAIPLLAEHFTVYAVDTRGHGQSSPVSELHYVDMAEDIAALIGNLQLTKPILYGFSDGGIIALLLAIRHPQLLSRIIVSGVNVSPAGLKRRSRALFALSYLFTKSPLIKLMLTEPNISPQELQAIPLPTTLLAGSRDMIRRTHLREIARHIPQSALTILPGESHGSYVIKSDKIAHLLLEICEKG